MFCRRRGEEKDDWESHSKKCTGERAGRNDWGRSPEGTPGRDRRRGCQEEIIGESTKKGSPEGILGRDRQREGQEAPSSEEGGKLGMSDVTNGKSRLNTSSHLRFLKYTLPQGSLWEAKRCNPWGRMSKFVSTGINCKGNHQLSRPHTCVF